MPAVPSVRGERIVRALERAGFDVARVTGSHHIMRHPDGRGTTVPVHQGRDVAKGTLRGICSASAILAVAIVIGIPSGIAAGRWAWTAFANAIGVVPAPVVPAAALALGVLALLAAGNILATWPAAIAVRTPVTLTLRSE
jgi:predicted RNA binding protein YcfA (HicA-like mRNA interferase family)